MEEVGRTPLRHSHCPWTSHYQTWWGGGACDRWLTLICWCPDSKEPILLVLITTPHTAPRLCRQAASLALCLELVSLAVLAASLLGWTRPEHLMVPCCSASSLRGCATAVCEAPLLTLGRPCSDTHQSFKQTTSAGNEWISLFSADHITTAHMQKPQYNKSFSQPSGF